MALYTKDSIERVKEAVDMVTLVGARTDLRRVGSRYTGLCPFHDERTPSFSVNPESKLYYCFGCGEKGDAIGFVQATEGVDFKDAVDLLAERTGVELKLEREDPRAEERRRRRERLLRLVERTAAYYARYLWDSAEAERAGAYLRERGLGEQVLRDFRVGYAPSAWDRVVIGAQADGFSVAELVAAGLAQRGKQGGFYDRFRGRIMFPLADRRGAVLGFGARAVRDNQQPKYLNTSENELYHKGRQLFGIDRARGPAAKAGRVVVVEGYTDVLALHQAGLTESVAIMGTALTQEQLAELSRAATVVYLALDADRSGQEAMLRASRGAQDRGMELRVVGMPEGTDPAELVAREGAEAFAALLDASLSVPEFEVRRAIADADLESPRGRDLALEAARPLIAAVPAGNVRDELVRHVSDRLEVPPENVVARLSEPPRREGGRAAPGGAGSERPGGRAAPRVGRAGAGGGPARGDGPGPSDGAEAPSLEAVGRAERTFLALCLGRGEDGREYLGRLGEQHLTSTTLARARDHLLEHFDDPLADLPPDDPTLTALVTEVVMRAEEEPSSEAVLAMSYLQLELRRVERELRQTGDARDFARQRSLWGEREVIKREMDEAMGQTA